MVFLNELRPHSLESFENSSNCHVGPDLFQALNCHGESLNELTLKILPPETISNLWLLKGCTNLVSLSLDGNWLGTTETQQSRRWFFLETGAWLKQCKKLRILAFTNFNANALVVPILLEESIRLTSLKYEYYRTRDTDVFFQALAFQTSLQSLWLKERASQYSLHGLNFKILVNSLSNLVSLTDLDLRFSDFFINRHIMPLACSLPKLEVWSINGCGLTDAIWGEIASLRSLRRLGFTADGILDFVKKLGPSVEGLVLSVSGEEILYDDLSCVDQELIQETIAKRVQGRFVYTMKKGMR